MLENLHRKRLNQLTNIKNKLSFYGSKFVLWTGFPFLLIYALLNTIICMFAVIGAAHLENESKLFEELPFMLPLTQLGLNTIMVLPIIAVIIYIIYSTIKILETHYIEKLNEL